MPASRVELDLAVILLPVPLHDLKAVRRRDGAGHMAFRVLEPYRQHLRPIQLERELDHEIPSFQRASRAGGQLRVMIVRRQFRTFQLPARDLELPRDAEPRACRICRCRNSSSSSSSPWFAHDRLEGDRAFGTGFGAGLEFGSKRFGSVPVLSPSFSTVISMRLSIDIQRLLSGVSFVKRRCRPVDKRAAAAAGQQDRQVFVVVGVAVVNAAAVGDHGVVEQRAVAFLDLVQSCRASRRVAGCGRG